MGTERGWMLSVAPLLGLWCAGDGAGIFSRHCRTQYAISPARFRGGCTTPDGLTPFFLPCPPPHTHPVVGTVCGIITALDKRGNDFNELMDSLNEFMIDIALPEELQGTLRGYFRYRGNHLVSTNPRQVSVEVLGHTAACFAAWSLIQA